MYISGLICDLCQKVFVMGYTKRKSDITEAAKQSGWTINRKDSICPTCTKNPPVKEEEKKE